MLHLLGGEEEIGLQVNIFKKNLTNKVKYWI